MSTTPKANGAWPSRNSRASARSFACSTVGQLLGGPRPELGQLHPAAALAKQRLAELLLEPADVAADRRLGQVQRLGRAVIAAVADDRVERTEVGGVEIHRWRDRDSALSDLATIDNESASVATAIVIALVAARVGRSEPCPIASSLPVFVLLWASGYVVGDLAIQVADPVPLLAVRFTLGHCSSRRRWRCATAAGAAPRSAGWR